MRKCLLFIISVWLLVPNIYGQEKIWGAVYDKNNAEPIIGALVTYISKESDMLTYVFTDAEGKFELKLNSSPKLGDSLKVTMLGYTSIVNTFPLSMPLSFRLEQSSFYIKEVRVTTPKIVLSGDTLKYNVQSFAESQDKNIEDVLKRMPGIEVMEGGAVYYNGKSIGNLFVDGLDIASGKYTLLTRNISVTDVKSIDIIEQHQPVKALKGLVIGDKAAINLRLHDKSRGKWIATLIQSAGFSHNPNVVWNSNLFMMRVGKKWNSVNNIKSNNTGVNIKVEVENDILVRDKREEPFSLGFGNAPLKDTRYRFNNDILLNSSNTWKLGKDWEINYSTTYCYEKLKSYNTSSTTYYFDNGNQTIVEDKQASSKNNYVESKFLVKANSDKFWFRNLLYADYEYKSLVQDLTGDYKRLQKVHSPNLIVKDNLEYIKRKGSSSFRFISNSGFSHYDGMLTVSSWDNQLNQDVSISDFRTDTYAVVDYNKRMDYTISITGGFKGAVRNLKSMLYGFDESILDTSDISFVNNVDVSYIRPYLHPSVEYSSKRWEVKGSLPASFAIYFPIKRSVFVYSAKAYVKYKPTSHLNFIFSSGVSNSELNINDFYDGYILSNYQTLNKGAMALEQDNSYNISYGVNYNNPLKLFYVDAKLQRTWNIYQHSYSQLFRESYIVNSISPLPSKGDAIIASISGNKGIYGINGKIGALFSYMEFYSTTNYRNGVNAPYTTKKIIFTPSIDARVAQWMGMSYKLSLSYTEYQFIRDNASIDAKNNYNQTLTISLTPANKIDFKLRGEHYYTTISKSNKKNTVLVDAVISYKLKNNLELNISALNLLNNKSYTYSIFNGLSEFTCEYNIRPFNFLFGISLNH